MIQVRPDHFISPLAYLEVGPNGKKFAAPSGIIQSLRCRYKSSPEIIYVVDDDVEDIFGHILQYLHSGDYSVLIPAADSSSHAACEDEIEIATQDLLPLKENYFASHEDIQVHSDNSIFLPHCGDGNHLCKHPKTLLVHARLYDFATRHGLDHLRNVSLNKLYWTLSEFPLDSEKADAIVELLRVANGIGTIYTLMIHYVSLHLKTFIRCSSFISFLEEDHHVSFHLFTLLCESL
ncbi:unnamed protein product [Penicillium camemberti]|uniref:Str. FM013 n=1 Tax=Penicillium camemberti (strain FM 013) TaxID=1429867 RepID=A0A0G4PER2_PENC3|nr:unnamed protein product [Penicillium camemberti]